MAIKKSQTCKIYVFKSIELGPSSVALTIMFFLMHLFCVSTVIQGKNFSEVNFPILRYDPSNRNTQIGNGNTIEIRTNTNQKNNYTSYDPSNRNTQMGNGNTIGIRTSTGKKNNYTSTSSCQAPIPVGHISTLGTSLAAHSPTISLAELDSKLNDLAYNLFDAARIARYTSRCNNSQYVAETLIDYLTLYHRANPDVNLISVASFLVCQNNIPYIPGFEDKVRAIQQEPTQKEQDATRAKQQEAARIRQQLESLPRLRINDRQEMTLLDEHCIRASRRRSANDRFVERTCAIEQTRKNHGKCVDYSSEVEPIRQGDQYAAVFEQTYGTALDCQLHKELCQTRGNMIQLEHDFPQSYHVQVFSPMVHGLAAQAKTEQHPSVAFVLSDFCHDLTQIVGKGVCALIKGPLNGAKEYFTLERLQQMATGWLNLGLMFIDAVGQAEEYELRQNRMLVAAFTGDHDSVPQLSQEYCMHSKLQWDTLKQNMHETYRRIKSMPWDELVEQGAKCGTMLMLDLLTFGAMNRFVGVAGRAVFSELSEAMESGVLFTQQHAIEVAGVGKVAIEYGPKVAAETMTTLKSSSELLTQTGKHPMRVMQETAAEISAKQGVNQACEAILKNGYYEVNGFKFSEYYYNKLWNTGREAPSLVAKEILKGGAKTASPDLLKSGFYKYIYDGWEMIYNPVTKEVWHLQPVR